MYILVAADLENVGAFSFFLSKTSQLEQIWIAKVSRKKRLIFLFRFILLKVSRIEVATCTLP